MPELSGLGAFAREATASVTAPPFESLVERVRTRRRRRVATTLAGLAVGAVVLAVATGLAGRSTDGSAPATGKVASDPRAVAVVKHPQHEILSEARSRESDTTVKAVAAPLPVGAPTREEYALLVQWDGGSRSQYVEGYPTVQHLDAGWFLVCTLTARTTYEPTLLVSARSTLTLRPEEARPFLMGDLIARCLRPLGPGFDVYVVNEGRRSVRPFVMDRVDTAGLAREYTDVPLDVALRSLEQDTLWVQARDASPWGLWREAAVWQTAAGSWRAHRLVAGTSDDQPLAPAAGPPGVMAFYEGVALEPKGPPPEQPILHARLHTSVDGGATWQVREVPGSLTGGHLVGDGDFRHDALVVPDGWEGWPRVTP